MMSLQPNRQAVPPEETRVLWEARDDMESFLRELRSRGAWQIESIKAVRQFAGVSLGDAKEIVHFSATWADMRAASEALHKAGYQALEQMQREDDLVLERLAS
jgi:ribosomal protein L7/L12